MPEEHLQNFGIGPVVITRGEGPYVFDDKGRKVINGFSCLWNVSVGHGRQELIDAATKQMTELAFASCFRQTHPRAIELADKLVQISPDQYQYVYLGTNGSEAVETALKISRQYFRQSPDDKEKGRYKVISLKHCYHGVSYGAMSTSGLAEDQHNYGPVCAAVGLANIDIIINEKLPENALQAGGHWFESSSSHTFWRGS